MQYRVHRQQLLLRHRSATVVHPLQPLRDLYVREQVGWLCGPRLLPRDNYDERLRVN